MLHLQSSQLRALSFKNLFRSFSLTVSKNTDSIISFMFSSERLAEQVEVSLQPRKKILFTIIEDRGNRKIFTDNTHI